MHDGQDKSNGKTHRAGAQAGCDSDARHRWWRVCREFTTTPAIVATTWSWEQMHDAMDNINFMDKHNQQGKDKSGMRKEAGKKRGKYIDIAEGMEG